jgi:hypothetical protein
VLGDSRYVKWSATVVSDRQWSAIVLVQRSELVSAFSRVGTSWTDAAPSRDAASGGVRAPARRHREPRSHIHIRRTCVREPRATTDSAMAVPEFLRRRAGPIVFKAEHARISAIFTLDAGGGRIRGVSVGAQALAAIFEPWVAPLRDLGMTMVSPRTDCGGDCRPFAEVGLPSTAAIA